LTKTPLIYNFSRFNSGSWSFVWEGKAHQSPPVATGLDGGCTKWYHYAYACIGMPPE